MTDAGGGTNRRRVSIRKSHPASWFTIMVVGAGSVAWAFNFWTSNPTFNPYSVSKNVIGVVFFALGFGQLFFLNVYQSRRMTWILVLTSIIWMSFWGFANTEQFRAGNASLQLPIAFLIVALIQIPPLVGIRPTRSN